MSSLLLESAYAFVSYFQHFTDHRSKPPYGDRAVISYARIYAGFHYRFSTIAGREMGQKIGAYVVKSVMQPAQAAMTH